MSSFSLHLIFYLDNFLLHNYTVLYVNFLYNLHLFDVFYSQWLVMIKILLTDRHGFLFSIGNTCDDIRHTIL